MSKAFQFACVKGSPYTYHVKEEGQWAAVCGKKPGERSRLSSHRNRTGWRVGATISGYEHMACATCISKGKLFGLSIRNGELHVEVVEEGKALS